MTMGLRFKGYFMSGSIGLISTAIPKMQTDNLLLVALCAHADQVHSLTSRISRVFAKLRPSSHPSLTLKCELLQQSRHIQYAPNHITLA